MRNVARVAQPAARRISVRSTHRSSLVLREEDMIRAAYVHLPFCRSKCFYCDFPISVLGTSEGNEKGDARMKRYVDAICEEIRSTPRQGDVPLKTVFFGGGTPSLVCPSMLKRILEALKDTFGVEDEAELSMEADPGTFNLERLMAFQSEGITRFSVGVQAFDEEMLRKCGRSHGIEDVYRAMEDIKAACPKSWSLDLISGLPGQTMPLWMHNVAETIRFQPDHVSIYDLQIEKGTAFGKWYTTGSAPLPSDSGTAIFYSHASRELQQAGYEHYEISNYARKGHRCKHNMVYWKNKEFYGFGLGATSHIRGARQERPKKMKDYYDWVAGYVAAGGRIQVAPSSKEENFLDDIMLGMRLSDGIDLSRLSATYGDQLSKSLEHGLRKNAELGLVSIEEDRGTLIRARLTDPDGFLFSNNVIAELFETIN